jgi:hypothetical protein
VAVGERNVLAILLRFSGKGARKFFGTDARKLANLYVVLHFGP